MWFRRGGTGDRNGQGVGGESSNNEGDENEFGEHDEEFREEEQIIMALGLRFRR